MHDSIQQQQNAIQLHKSPDDESSTPSTSAPEMSTVTADPATSVLTAEASVTTAPTTSTSELTPSTLCKMLTHEQFTAKRMQFCVLMVNIF